jgi:hypothetical protein
VIHRSKKVLQNTKVTETSTDPKRHKGTAIFDFMRTQDSLERLLIYAPRLKLLYLLDLRFSGSFIRNIATTVITATTAPDIKKAASKLRSLVN